MSTKNQVTTFATLDAVRHIADELRQELKEDMQKMRGSVPDAVRHFADELRQELKEDMQEMRGSVLSLQTRIDDLNDDMKIIKDQVMILSRDIDSSQARSPSEQGCSSSRDIRTVTVTVDDNEIELRTRTSSKGGYCLTEIVQ